MGSPGAVRYAGVVVAAEGAVGLALAAALVLRGLAGADARISFGTAAWFALIGAAVVAAGWALTAGRRWGRGVAVVANLLLLGVAWYAALGSHRWAYGIPLALVGLLVLGLLFSRAAIGWAAGEGQPDAASRVNPDPDSR